jgi:hypothetical protein
MGSAHPHMLDMTKNTTNRYQDHDPESIARWNNENGAPELLDVAPCAVRRAAGDPRGETLAPTVPYDLWRFSCEMPDAPHLRNNLMPP